MKLGQYPAVKELIEARKTICKLNGEKILSISAAEGNGDKCCFRFGGQKAGGHEPEWEARHLLETLDQDFLKQLNILFDGYKAQIEKRLTDLGVEL